MRAVGRDDILVWANGPRASMQLPSLIRRLILESATAVTELNFPADGGVTSGGFDGVVRNAAASLFVPEGLSCWELSVEKNANTKANTDFAKRLEGPDGSPLEDSTYIQVICRPWTKSAVWSTTSRAVGRWRDVRALNVDSIATWLDQCPATQQWMSELLGKPVVGVVSATRWWDNWSNATNPPMSSTMVLSRPNTSALRDCLERPGLSTIAGPLGIDELIACIVAAATEQGRAERMVVVGDAASAASLLASSSSVELVLSQPAIASSLIVEARHRVFVPVPFGTGDCSIDLIDGHALVEILRTVAPEVEGDLGAIARRSLVAFRRRIAVRRELMRPVWAELPANRCSRCALLVTEWDDHEDGDREVVARLTGMPYTEAKEEFIRLAAGSDPLLNVQNGRWHLVSPTDAWAILGGHLTRDDLIRFSAEVEQVLGERDPAFDLPDGERWMAAIKGQRRRHSEALRAGFARGLALLGTAEDIRSATGMDGEAWANKMVRPMFIAANGERWASLSEHLPTLMEAAPTTLLRELSKGIAGSEPTLRAIFQDTKGSDFLFGRSAVHSGVLWALERAAWAEDHFSSSCRILTALAAMDPGGTYANRPSASLVAIFRPWMPLTSASPEQRLLVLDLLRRSFPTQSWDLMLALLPNDNGLILSNEPEYRTWKAERTITMAECWASLTAVVDRLVDDAATDANRWVSLLDAHPHLPPGLRRTIINGMAAAGEGNVDDAGRVQLSEALRQLVSSHRRFADADWALPSDEVTRLDQMREQFASEDLAQKYHWLFANSWVELDDVALRGDYNEHESEVRRRRSAAIVEIYAQHSFDGVRRLAATSDARLVGAAFADAIGEIYVPSAITWLDEGAAELDLGLGYLWRLARERSTNWTLGLLESDKPIGPESQAKVLLLLDNPSDGIIEAQRRGGEVERAYWRSFGTHGLGTEVGFLAAAATGLISVDRCAAALDLLSRYPMPGEDVVRAMLVAQALERLISSGGTDDELRSLRAWGFERIFDLLDQNADAIGMQRVLDIEWYFFPLLGHHPPTTTLHRRMSLDPAYFVQMVCLVFRAASEVDSTTNSDGNVATNAWRLLHSWTIPPGISPDGDLSSDDLRAWLAHAIDLLCEADREEAGLRRIGEILTYTPATEHGWPSIEVADLIEEAADENIETGITIAIQNRRGVTSRGMLDGGDQERELASSYRAHGRRFRDTHPRLAQLFVDVAETYEHEAGHHDASAEKRRRGLW